MCAMFALITLLTESVFAQKQVVERQSFASLALEFHDDLVRSDESSYLTFLQEFKSNLELNPSQFELAVKNRLLGSYHLKFAHPGDALTYQFKALHYFYSIEDYSVSSRIANDIANAYLLLDNQTNAQKHYHLSMRLADLSTNEEDRFVSYYNYARLKLAQEDTVYALALLRNYRDACQRFERYESLADCYSLLAEISLAQKRKELAEEYFVKALKASKQTDSKLAEANVLSNQAILTFQQGDSIVASKLFHQGLTKRIEIGNKRMVADAYFNLGSFHYFSNRCDSAIYYFEKSRDFSLSNDLFLDAIDAIDVLIEISLEEKVRRAYSLERKEVEASRDKMRTEHESLLQEMEISVREGEKSLRSTYNLSNLLLMASGGVLLFVLIFRLKISSIWRDTQD